MAELTTDDVRESFVEQSWFREDFYTELAYDPYAEGKANAEYAFDRWLNQVKAEAWSEGYQQSYRDTVGRIDRGTYVLSENPYRGEQ